jgi:Bacterial aa3 type cytochrome c oxidase subunit IV
MAVEGEARGEIQAHRSGYSLFVWLMKWGAIVSFVVTMFVVFLISS